MFFTMKNDGKYCRYGFMRFLSIDRRQQSTCERLKGSREFNEMIRLSIPLCRFSLDNTILRNYVFDIFAIKQSA